MRCSRSTNALHGRVLSQDRVCRENQTLSGLGNEIQSHRGSSVGKETPAVAPGSR
jgi:hypothetical protein